MAKWRDVKQSRTTQKKEKEKSTSFDNSNLNASIPARLKAFLTDTFLITTPIFYIVIYLIMGSGEEFAQNRSLGWGIIIAVHSLIIIGFLYIKTQTPGMKAYGIALVDNSSQQRASFFQIIIRYLATIFAVVSLFLMFVPFFNKEKKTFQDIISNTININSN